MTAKSSLLSRCSTVFSLPILPMGFLLVLAAGLIGCTAGASTDPNAPPVVTAICPASITAGGPDFTLEIDGSNFGPGSVVLWNGAVRRTTYQCPTQMRVAITAADIAAPGTAQVVVTNPARGTSSGILTFTIASATNPVPTLTSLRPSR